MRLTAGLTSILDLASYRRRVRVQSGSLPNPHPYFAAVEAYLTSPNGEWLGSVRRLSDGTDSVDVADSVDVLPSSLTKARPTLALEICM